MGCPKTHSSRGYALNSVPDEKSGRIWTIPGAQDLPALNFGLATTPCNALYGLRRFGRPAGRPAAAVAGGAARARPVSPWLAEKQEERDREREGAERRNKTTSASALNMPCYAARAHGKRKCCAVRSIVRSNKPFPYKTQRIPVTFCCCVTTECVLSRCLGYFLKKGPTRN